jgi:L-lysine 2,3-aminomutase
MHTYLASQMLDRVRLASACVVSLPQRFVLSAMYELLQLQDDRASSITVVIHVGWAPGFVRPKARWQMMTVSTVLIICNVRRQLCYHFA